MLLDARVVVRENDETREIVLLEGKVSANVLP